MPPFKFNARSIDAIKPPKGKPQEDYWDVGLTGFGLRVSSEGRKTWFVKYRYKGRRPRVSFGTYPVMPLADARVQAQKILHDATLGVDTSDIKRAGRQAETIRELADEYLNRHAKVNKKSWKEDERILEREIISKWVGRKAKEITRRDVIHLLDAIVERGAPIQANRVLALVRKLFNFGIQRDIVDVNPCYQVQRPSEENTRDRVLSADEIRAVWGALEGFEPLISAIFKLSLITAQRGNEIRTMRWSEVDLKAAWWTIPAERAKNGFTHRVPLSPSAIEILKGLAESKDGSPWVFPSPIAPAKHIDHVQKAVQRVRARAGVVKKLFAEGIEPTPEAMARAVLEGYKPMELRGHDLRRTAASHMTSIGISRLVVSKILNHVEQGITAVYDRHSYDAEKREAMERWGAYLLEIIAGREEHRVIPLKRQDPDKRIKGDVTLRMP